MALRTDYFLGETLSNLRRNLLMTLAAISTVAVSLFLFGGVMVMGEIVNNTVGEWEKLIEVDVFLRDEITPEQQKELETAVVAMPEVKDVKYLSKEDAFNEFKEIYKDAPAVWENVDASALPALYRIELHDPQAAEAVTTRLEGRPGVDEVRFGGDDVKRLLQINSLLRRMMFVFVAILLAAAMLLIANTIRLAIYARRREIAIMKLVGATNWFVRVPFLFEGLTEGALGAVVAASVLLVGKMLLLDPLQQQMIFLPLTVGFDVIAKIFLVLVVVGMLVGMAGSTLALRRHLEV